MNSETVFFPLLLTAKTCAVSLLLFLFLAVPLSYWLAGIPAIGVIGIWWSIPIGWFIADVIGIIYYKYRKSSQTIEFK